LSGRGLCDELITRPEESYRLWCVVVCDLETSRIGAPYIYMTLVASYIYDISSLRVKVTDMPCNYLTGIQPCCLQANLTFLSFSRLLTKMDKELVFEKFCSHPFMPLTTTDIRKACSSLIRPWFLDLTTNISTYGFHLHQHIQELFFCFYA